MWYPKPTIDDRDREILARRMAFLDAKTGPRVGDWVIMPNGETRRLTYHLTDGEGWDGGFQTTCVEGDTGSFCLVGLRENLVSGPEVDASLSYSGSLDAAIPTEEMVDTGETRDARLWFFHHDFPGAGNGVEFTAPFRVYRVKPGAFADKLDARMREMSEIRGRR